MQCSPLTAHTLLSNSALKNSKNSSRSLSSVPGSAADAVFPQVTGPCCLANHLKPLSFFWKYFFTIRNILFSELKAVGSIIWSYFLRIIKEKPCQSQIKFIFLNWIKMNWKFPLTFLNEKSKRQSPGTAQKQVQEGSVTSHPWQCKNIILQQYFLWFVWEAGLSFWR